MRLFENLTPEIVLERILNRMDPARLQTREGSYVYDQAAPIAREIWRLYMTLDELIDAFYINEFSGPYIDAHGALFNVVRREGTKAACEITMEGKDGAVIPAGTAFYTEDGLEYGLTADVTLQGGAGRGLLRASAVGQKYNVGGGSVVQILRNVRGLDSFQCGEATGGTDPESDEALFLRVDERRKRPATSGNVQHYREWALSVDGVGAVRVTPLWRGNGTVKVLIAGYDRLPVDDTVVARCAAYIETKRPIGAKVTVASAIAEPVRVSARLVALPSVSRAAVRERLRELVEEYLAETAFEEFVVYAHRVGALIMAIDGVVDYQDLLLNGQEGNLALDTDHVPVLEEVEVL